MFLRADEHGLFLLRRHGADRYFLFCAAIGLYIVCGHFGPIFVFNVPVRHGLFILRRHDADRNFCFVPRSAHI